MDTKGFGEGEGPETCASRETKRSGSLYPVTVSRHEGCGSGEGPKSPKFRGEGSEELWYLELRTCSAGRTPPTLVYTHET